jgi:hypothetical protein
MHSSAGALDKYAREGYANVQANAFFTACPADTANSYRVTVRHCATLQLACWLLLFLATTTAVLVKQLHFRCIVRA